MTFKKGQTAWNKCKKWNEWMSEEGKEKSLSNLKTDNNLGKKATSELKKKLSESQKKAWSEGKYKDRISQDKKGDKNPFYGKKHTEESIRNKRS